MKKAPRLLLAGVVALIGVAPAAVGRAENLTNAGTVTAVAGPVTVTRLLATPQPLKFRDSLFWRDVVEARKDGIARVLLAGQTTVTVRELSRLELREEATAEGIRYTAELVSGKVRASVARMLMRPGDQVEVRTRNAVASVRGTDFIVETLALPSQARAFGLMGFREVAPAVADGGSQSGETVVVTLSGVVAVQNRLAGSGRVERVGAYEVVRVSGRQDPLRFQVSADDLRVLLRGLTPPRPQEARSGDKSEAVGNKVERVAVATSAQSVRVFEQAGGDGGSRGRGQDGDQGGQSGSRRSGGQTSQSGGQSASTPSIPGTPAASATPPSPHGAPGVGPGNGQGNGLALGQGNSEGLALGQGNGNGNGPALGPATPAVAAVPATPAIPAPPATPAVAATPATPATPAVAATPAPPATPAVRAVPAITATPSVAGTPATPATPAGAAVPAAPAANPGNGQGVSKALGKGNSAKPPGQAKK